MLPFFTRALGTGLALALLAGCVRPAQPDPTLTPLATLVPTLAAPTALPATAVPLPTRVPATAVPTQPVVGFDPQVGGPGTSVVVFGSGYLPGAPVVVRLGFPQPVGEALASAVPDADGTWHAMLVIPERLPSGEVITRGDMFLVVMDAQNQPLASAPFGFIRGAEPEPPLDTSWPGAGWTSWWPCPTSATIRSGPVTRWRRPTCTRSAGWPGIRGWIRCPSWTNGSA